MLPLRPLGVSLLALSLFLALAVPALADSGAYGTVDIGTGSTGTTRDTPLLLPPATIPAAGATAGAAASEAAAPGRAGGLQPALVALILSGLGGLLLSSGLVVRRRGRTGRVAPGRSMHARPRG